jgi:uncharacterized membrane protein
MYFFTLYSELTACIIFLVVIINFIKKKDYRSAGQIISGSVFGITLEFMNVLVFKTYTYSTKFIIQIGDAPDNIPICIGLCWGLIIYCCIKVSDKIGLAEWSRPILDGLLALTIDLSMDTIAIRLDGGFWTWTGIPMEPLPTLNGFFGVSYGNFIGWFFVVMIFSSLLRFEKSILRDKLNISGAITVTYFCIIPLFAYIPLFLCLIFITKPITLVLGTQLAEQTVQLLTLSLVLILAVVTQIAAYLIKKPVIERDVDWLSIFIFMYFHLTFLSFYIAASLFVNDFPEAPFILLLGFTMLVIDIFIHWSILDKDKLRDQMRSL